MKKLISILLTLGLSMSAICSYAQMTDDQVISYVKQATEQGKGQNEITAELLARGVTADQVKRIKDKVSASNSAVTTPAPAQTTRNNARQARTSAYTRPAYNAQGANLTSPESRPVAIFGHDVFGQRENGISFEPNENIATPENYKLGPGDEVIIELWGYNEANIKQTISPEGKISIQMVGPVHLAGLTVKEAEKKIKRVLSSKYSGIEGANPSTEVSVALGAIRTIQVSVMGDVAYPGTYRISSFSTVFSALYAAGGVSKTGSLRAIKVMRGGKEIAKADIYEYIFEGKTSGDIRLQDSDVILVPAYANVVSAAEGFKRPLRYEMAQGETVADLLRYSGGLTGRAYEENISIIRQTGSSSEVLTAYKESGYNVELRDGDVVSAGVTDQYYTNRLEIRGFVVNPGVYQLGEGIASVKQLISAAGGLKADAFLGRAILNREKEDRSYETLPIDLGAVMKGTRPDVALRKGDVLIIRGIHEINDRGVLIINGLVNNPGTFPYAENTTIEDLIVLAGGLQDGASMAKVDVSRRLDDPYGLEPSIILGESFSFSIKDGLAVDGADAFYLKPYDVVSVRRSPNYQPQQFVRIEGEISFPGQYVLQNTGETLSSIVERAGGVTSLAYLKGAKLTRYMTLEERRTAESTLEIEKRNIQNRLLESKIEDESNEKVEDLAMEALEIKTSYVIAVDFEKALANPNTYYDIVLREGDVLSIPKNVGTVAIKGEVLYANTVQYVSGKPLSYYLNQAGGYNNEAKKSGVYVVYMNGSIQKGGNAKIEPGCEIVVPRKKARRQASAAEILSIGTSAASLSTMVISLVNMFSK